MPGTGRPTRRAVVPLRAHQDQEAARSRPAGKLFSSLLGERPPGGNPDGGSQTDGGVNNAPRKPRRLYGSVEIDMVRPVKAFDAILNAIVMELQRTQGAKVKLTLEIEGEALEGFAEGEVSIVRDNAKQLKFRSEATGFEE